VAGSTPKVKEIPGGGLTRPLSCDINRPNMRTFLYFTGLITAIFSVAYGTAFLITLGWNPTICYILYLAALGLIGLAAHLINDRYMEYDDGVYVSTEYDTNPTYSLKNTSYRS
jgi:hypothetical protein